MFFRNKCEDCAPRDLVISLREQKDRAEDVAVALENKIDRMQDENKILKSKNEVLEQESRYLLEKLQAAEGEADMARKAFDGLRARIHALLRSADVDAQIFGLPRYTDLAELPDVDPGRGKFGRAAAEIPFRQNG